MTGSWHDQPRAVDVTVSRETMTFVRGFTNLLQAAQTAAALLSRPGMMLIGRMPPRRPPATSSADRTRSPRWRAGTRRTRRMARAAKRRGRRSHTAGPLIGWTDLMWVDETAGWEGLGSTVSPNSRTWSRYDRR